MDETSLKELVKIANKLDSMGHRSLANKVDSVVSDIIDKKAATVPVKNLKNLGIYTEQEAQQSEQWLKEALEHVRKAYEILNAANNA